MKGNNTFANTFTDTFNGENKIKIKKLKMVAINVNSIIQNQRRGSLLNFLKKNDPDIAALGETKLNHKHKIEFKDYNIIRRDRPNAKQGGGVALLIKRELKFKQIILAEVEQFKNIEAVIISINLQNNKKLYVIAVYAAHEQSERGKFNEDIIKLFEILKLDDPDNYFVLAGDLNARHTSWSNAINNTRGTFLRKWIDDNKITYKLKLYSSSLSSFPRGDSYLDLCIADNRLQVAIFENTNKLETLNYDSDHNAIQMRICYKSDMDFLLEKMENPHKLNYKKTNWEKFSNYLQKEYSSDIPNNKNLSNEEIETYIRDINTAITMAINNTVPKIKNRNSMECYQTPLIMKIHKQKSLLITKINNIYRQFKTHNNRQLNLLKNNLLTVKALLKQEYIKSVNNYWSEKISNIPENDPKHMFPQVNQIFRSKGKISIPQLKIQDQNMALLQEANINVDSLLRDETGKRIITNEEDKLKVIGTHFQKTPTKYLHFGRERLNEIIQEKITNLETEIENDKETNRTVVTFSDELKSDDSFLLQKRIPNFFTSYIGLTKIFRKLNNKKSSGVNGMPNIALKHITPTLIHDYCILFNNMLNNSFFPAEWKKSKITPIPKKGNESTNCRLGNLN